MFCLHSAVHVSPGSSSSGEGAELYLSGGTVTSSSAGGSVLVVSGGSNTGTITYLEVPSAFALTSCVRIHATGASGNVEMQSAATSGAGSSGSLYLNTGNTAASSATGNVNIATGEASKGQSGMCSC